MMVIPSNISCWYGSSKNTEIINNNNVTAIALIFFPFLSRCGIGCFLVADGEKIMIKTKPIKDKVYIISDGTLIYPTIQGSKTK